MGEDQSANTNFILGLLDGKMDALLVGHSELRQAVDDHDKRISGLEKFNAKVIGITIGISAIASVIDVTVTTFLYDFWSTLITP